LPPENEGPGNLKAATLPGNFPNQSRGAPTSPTALFQILASCCNKKRKSSFFRVQTGSLQQPKKGVVFKLNQINVYVDKHVDNVYLQFGKVYHNRITVIKIILLKLRYPEMDHCCQMIGKLVTTPMYIAEFC